MYFQFVSYLHIDITYVVEILPHVGQEPANIMVFDDLATQGARASATMMLTYLNKLANNKNGLVPDLSLT